MATAFPLRNWNLSKRVHTSIKTANNVVVWRVRRIPRRVIALLLFSIGTSALARDSASIVRWTEGEPGCTFSAGEDGLYRYAFWTGDFGIIMAVDADELRKADSRTEPTFAVLLTVRYRGNDSLSVHPETISLEFVKHDHDKHPAIAPDDLSARLQRDADTFSERAKREVRKHPEKKPDEEAALQEREKSIQAMIEFVKARGLATTELDAGHPQVSGWLFFSAKSKWIGDWKQQEEFILRVPLANHIVEFPFALPPSKGDLILRRRPSP